MKYRVTRKMPEFRKPKDPEIAMWQRKLMRVSDKLDLVNVKRVYCIACKLLDLLLPQEGE